VSVAEQRYQAVLAVIEDVAGQLHAGRTVHHPDRRRGPPVLDVSASAQRRIGDDWISRRVASNGISLTSQPFSVGKHHSGAIVDVHVSDRPLAVWSGNQLIRTIARTSAKEVRKKGAEKNARNQS
jgi:hypothetical protein